MKLWEALFKFNWATFGSFPFQLQTPPVRLNLPSAPRLFVDSKVAVVEQEEEEETVAVVVVITC